MKKIDEGRRLFWEMVSDLIRNVNANEDNMNSNCSIAHCSDNNPAYFGA